MAKMQTYQSQADAQEVVDKMRQRGWPKANTYDNGGYYVITVHGQPCSCGRCPHLQDDGCVN